MGFEITPVKSKSDRRDFYNLAWRVYHDDLNWVPHLWPQRKAYLEKRAAFFTYGEGEFWLAKKKGETVGTIGGAINHSLNRDKGIRTAIFGFFEVLPDGTPDGHIFAYEVARQLWDHVREWGCSHGMDELRGPTSFSPNDENGFLIQGYEYPPCVMMGHTHPHYPIFAERYGFQKLLDSMAYRYELSQINFDVQNGPVIFHRIAERARLRHGESVIRNPCMDDWDSELERLHDVYNRSLTMLPEFTPLELAEFRAQADVLKSIIDPELVFLAEVDGNLVGFALGLPNIMEALIHAHGLRYPWDYIRLVWARRYIRGASFKILAIDPHYWGYGLEAIMFVEIGKALIRKGYTWVDGSLTGEENPQTHKLAARLGAKVYRVYREYRIDL